MKVIQVKWAVVHYICMPSVRDLSTSQKSEISHDFERYMSTAPSDQTVQLWSHKRAALGFNILSVLKPGLKPEWAQWSQETEHSAKTHHTPNIYLKWTSGGGD